MRNKAIAICLFIALSISNLYAQQHYSNEGVGYRVNCQRQPGLTGRICYNEYNRYIAAEKLYDQKRIEYEVYLDSSNSYRSCIRACNAR